MHFVCVFLLSLFKTGFCSQNAFKRIVLRGDLCTSGTTTIATTTTQARQNDSTGKLKFHVLTHIHVVDHI